MGSINTRNNTSDDKLRSKRIELIVRQLESLPTLSAVATKLLRSATAEDISVKEVVSLIESDQTLTARLLSLASKAHLGLGSSVNTVEKAVLMLGFEAVRNMVLSVKVFETFGSGSNAESGFDRVEFWKHSLAVACAAQLIGEKLPNKSALDQSELFVCGLLHDIGKVALDTALPKSFARIAKIAENNRSSIADVERRILGIDHCGFGKRLGEYWKLPEPIVNTIWLHHHKASNLPESISYRELAEIIYLADLIAREQRIGFSGNFIFADNAEDLCKQMGIDADGYQDILTNLRSAIGERAEFLGLNDITSESLYRQALQNANTELGRLNRELSNTGEILKIRARYFDAINTLNRSVKPHLSVIDMLEYFASSARKAMDISSVIVYRQDKIGNCIETCFCDADRSEVQIFESLDLKDSDVPFTESKLIINPPEFLNEVITYFSRKFSRGDVKVIGLRSNRDIIGGIIFCVDDKTLTRLEREKSELQALCATISLMLANSLAIERADNLANELLSINRQMHELERKLIETKYMAGLGELAAGAAHELNNPLAIISGRAQLLVSEEPDEQKQKALNIIIEQASRASDIISGLMDFARPIRPERQVIEIKSFMNNLIDRFIRDHHLNSDQLIVDISEQAKSAFCDPQQLAAAINEILENALDVCGKEDLKIDIKVVSDDEGEYTYIKIADNGPGMEPQILNRAFEPFFSAQPAGRKRGLGLSRAYRYIQSNDGVLWLESQQGEGTTAFIKVPSRQNKK